MFMLLCKDLWLLTVLRATCCSRRELMSPSVSCRYLKKGAKLELSLVHQLFNLGNNKNIKWIPVFLCYNRSTTEWKRRESETKPMTSERSKRVGDKEGTSRRARRWQERPSGHAERQGLMPVQSEGRQSERWRRAVQLLRETRGRSRRSRVGVQTRLNSQQK